MRTDTSSLTRQVVDDYSKKTTIANAARRFATTQCSFRRGSYVFQCVMEEAIDDFLKTAEYHEAGVQSSQVLTHILENNPSLRTRNVYFRGDASAIPDVALIIGISLDSFDPVSEKED